MKRLAKEEAEKRIKEFFGNLEDKAPRGIKKMKRLAMHHNIKLGYLRKKFCKKCFSVFPENAKIRIKKKTKIIKCRNCGYIGRWKIK